MRSRPTAVIATDMSARGRDGRQRLSPEQRREEILAAAHRVFSSQDPSAVTFEEIAHEAGVSRALVYNYFGDKGNLLAEVYRQALGSLDGALLEVLESGQSPAARLRDLARRYVEFAQTSTGTWQMLAHAAVVQHPAVQRVRRERVRRLAHTLGDADSSELAVAGLLGLLESTTRHWLDASGSSAETMLEHLDLQVWTGFSGLLDRRVGTLAG